MGIKIDLNKGRKVVYANPDAGYLSDQETAVKHLKLGQTYTVDKIKVGNWRTSVFLIGFPAVQFNSVLFNDVEDK